MKVLNPALGEEGILEVQLEVPHPSQSGQAGIGDLGALEVQEFQGLQPTDALEVRLRDRQPVAFRATIALKTTAASSAAMVLVRS
jgi:hypothetical protein